MKLMNTTMKLANMTLRSDSIFGHEEWFAYGCMNSGRTLTVLGDWIRQNTYATFDGEELKLHTFAVEKHVEADV